jgi:hypothetical protein
MNTPSKKTGDATSTGNSVPEKPRIVSLMNEIIVSINDRADIYHWNLIGDSPECILNLIECGDENLRNHILDLCGLYDSKKKQYTKVVRENWDIFQPCEIVPYALKTCNDKDQTLKRKVEYYLRVGSRNSGNGALSGQGK